MATMVTARGRNAPDIGTVLSNAFGALARRPVEILAIALPLGGIPSALSRVISAHLVVANPGSIWMPVWTSIGINILLSGLWMTAVFGLLARLVVSEIDGTAETVANAARNVFQRFPILVVISLLQNLAVGFSMLLLIVPGLMLMTAWTMANAAASLEHLGPIEALRRSAALTRGARWPVFGLLVIIGVIDALVGVIGNRVATLIDGHPIGFGVGLGNEWPIGYIAVLGTLYGFIVALGGSVHATLYVQLRDWKDGPQTDTLAEVFA